MKIEGIKMDQRADVFLRWRDTKKEAIIGTVTVHLNGTTLNADSTPLWLLRIRIAWQIMLAGIRALRTWKVVDDV